MATIVEPPSSPAAAGKRAGLAAVAFFLLLSSYYILRPVRDEMGVQTGVERLPWLFTATFLCTLAVVPLFGWIVQRCPRSVLIPLVYGALIASLFGFYADFSLGVTKTAAAMFFIWLSLFSLMIVSLFWSAVSDAFSTSQAEQNYGYISAGGTAGAIVGPLITTATAERLGAANLLLVSAGLMFLAVLCLMSLRRRTDAAATKTRKPIGGSIFGGITETVRSPLLRSLAGLAICYSTISTSLYLEMTAIVSKTYADPGQRTAFFARIDLAVNLAALAIQLFVTQKIIQKCGLKWALTVAPAIALAGAAIAAVRPSAMLFALVQAAHRACEYALSKPSREILFTTVDAEGRYKAKNFIDTAVYRANDSASSWVITAIRSAGGNALWWVAVPTACAWLFLGRRAGGMLKDLNRSSTAAAGVTSHSANAADGPSDLRSERRTSAESAAGHG